MYCGGRFFSDLVSHPPPLWLFSPDFGTYGVKSTHSYKFIKVDICTAAERSVSHLTSTPCHHLSRSSCFSSDFGTYGVKSTKSYKIIKANIRTATGRSIFHVTSTHVATSTALTFLPAAVHIFTLINLLKILINLFNCIQMY